MRGMGWKKNFSSSFCLFDNIKFVRPLRPIVKMRRKPLFMLPKLLSGTQK